MFMCQLCNSSRRPQSTNPTVSPIMGRLPLSHVSFVWSWVIPTCGNPNVLMELCCLEKHASLGRAHISHVSFRSHLGCHISHKDHHGPHIIIKGHYDPNVDIWGPHDICFGITGCYDSHTNTIDRWTTPNEILDEPGHNHAYGML